MAFGDMGYITRRELAEQCEWSGSTASMALAHSCDGSKESSGQDDDETCCVCGQDAGDEDDELVFCDGSDCNVIVHQTCYGIKALPEGDWFCDVCLARRAASSKRERDFTPRCPVCPRTDGAFVRTFEGRDGGWAHVNCTLFHGNGVGFEDPEHLKQAAGFQKIEPAYRALKCCFCGTDVDKRSGAKIQCCHGRCQVSFHPSCAIAAKCDIEGVRHPRLVPEA